ncbi:MAG: prohibitin family protein [Flavobacteriales bacterium]|nr:prohibitin family protein [Flavobacteriales bacterium]
MKNTIIMSLGIIFLSSCAIVRPGEVGIKRTFGKLHGKTKSEGIVWINPFVTQVIKVKVSTVNKEVKLNLPSKEGLNVNAEISILYHVKPKDVVSIIKEVGLSYERILILSTFRSSAADVCARFLAKDMHSGKRAQIEEEIKKQMTELLKDRGVVIEAILLKSISLPAGLYQAIEAKLQAEQQAQQMEFILDRERQEAERKKIEAEGIKNAQQIIKEGITEENIEWKSLEVFRELSSSPNTKIIFTDGTTPMLMDGNP